MIVSQNICYNCFAEKLSGDQACQLCGYDERESTAKYPVALKAGSILNGQYIVGRVLGQGGFGITYLAMDYQLKIKVAIKEYLPDGMATRLPDTTLVSVYVGDKQEHFSYGAERFLDEARVLAKFIGNRNIAGVKSYFTENNTSYFVMDYIEGISFKSYIKNKGGKVAYTDALRVLSPVMDALAAVHKEGFIHRDVTPDNIYITKDNEIKLLDFGSARYSLGDKSRSLDVILKAGYAPKEQYIRRGKQGSYTDIYSLAACFYASITGYLPPEALERMEEDEIVPISTRGIRIPDSLEYAIMKGLEVRAEDRWQSIEEFKAGIDNADSLTIPQTNGTVIAAQAQSNDKMQVMQDYVTAQASGQPGISVQPEPVTFLQISKGSEQPLASTTGNKFIAFIKKNRVASLLSVVACLIAVTSLVAVIFIVFIKNDKSGTGSNIVTDANVDLGSEEYVSDLPSGSSPADETNPQIEDTTLDSTEEDEVSQIEESSADSEDAAAVKEETGEAETDIAETDIAETDIAETDIAETDKAEADKEEAEEAEADEAEVDEASDKAASDKAAADKAAADKAAADKAAADKAAADKAAADKAAADKAADDKATVEKSGNTVGNIVNGGAFAERDGWIYYSNESDGGKLYKMSTDGKEVTMLSDDFCLYINVADKWVYYWDGRDGGLYKIRTDGTKRTQLSEDECWYINVVDGWVYYGIFPLSGSGGLYKIRTDGTDKTKLSDDECSHINVVDGWVYYRNGNDDDKIYKIRTDGSERTNISDDAYGFINVVDGWIYYMYGLYAQNGDDKLYKMRTDGTERTKLSDDECSFINVADGWVYYSNYSDDRKLYKVRIDGTKRTKLTEDQTTSIYVVDDWVYYDNSSERGKLYKMRTDGTEQQLVD